MTDSVINPSTGNLDQIGMTGTEQGSFLKLDQTTPQDISNGQPDFLAGLRAGSTNQLSIDASGNLTTTGTGTFGQLDITDANTYLSKDGSNNLSFTDAVTGTKTLAELAAGGSPGGADTQVQFNDSSAFGGSANFTYDKTTKLLKVFGDGGSVALSIGDPADTGTATQTISNGGAFNAFGYNFEFNVYACQNKGGQIVVYSETPENIQFTDDNAGFNDPTSSSYNYWTYDASANYDWNDMPYLSGGSAAENGSGSYMTNDSPVYTIYSYRTIRGTLYYCTVGETTSANPTAANDNVAFDVSWNDPSDSTIEGYKILCTFGGNTVSTTVNQYTFTVNDPGNWSGDATVTPTVTQYADNPRYKIYAYKSIGGTTYYSKTPYEYNDSYAYPGMVYNTIYWTDSTTGSPDGYRIVCTFEAADKWRDIGSGVQTTTDYGTNDANWTAGTPTLTPNYKYNITLAWDAVADADFYRVSITDPVNSYTDNYYIETTNTGLVYDGTTGLSRYHPDATYYPGFSASKTVENDATYLKGNVRSNGGFCFDSGDVDYLTLDDFVTNQGSGIKCFWNPKKIAFRAGSFTGGQTDDANVGLGSVAFGDNNTAKGNNSFAVGTNANATARYGIAMGNGSIAGDNVNDNGCISIGQNCSSTADGATAIGNACYATASYATAIGGARANGNYSTSLGFGYANGSNSVYIGSFGYAYADQSVAIGYYPVVASNATGGIAIGYGVSSYDTCYVSSPYGVAIGYKTHAEYGSYATSIGKGCINYLGTSIALGNDRINELIYGDTVNIIDSTSVGTEKLTNGTFTGSATGWTLASGWTYNTNLVRKDGNGTGTLSQTSAAMATPLVVGEVYQLRFTISSVTVAGTVIPACGGVTLDTLTLAAGTYTRHFKATSTADLTFTPTNTSRFYIDTISLKKITGGNLYVAKDFKVDGSSTLGSVSTDTVTCTARFLPRDVGQDPTAVATAGTRGEIVYYNDKWYGKTVGSGTDTNWSALN